VKTAEKHKCPGFEKDCSEMIGPTKELCARCYGRRWYAQKHPKKKAAASVKSKKKTNGHFNGNGNGHSISALHSRGDLAALKVDLQKKLDAIALVESLL
jgi:hypothetical protein